jgi:exodeoxyribonuclease V alpha subunit
MSAAPTLFRQSESRMGRITAIRWKASNSSRCIVSCIDDATKKAFSVVGDIEEPAVGQLYEFEGRVEWNDKFRVDQMTIASCRTVLPSDTMGIERYLTGTAKWVGPAIARDLTKAFGQDTLKVIKADPYRIAAATAGITIERAREMQKSLVDNEKNELAAVEVAQLLGASLPARFAKKAIKKWGSSAAAIIRRNPFKLTELHGCGFASADAVYRARKLPLDSPRRHAAAVLHAIRELHITEGHTIVEERILLRKASELVGEVSPQILAWLHEIGRLAKVPPSSWADADIHSAEEFIASCFRGIKPDESATVTVVTGGLASDQIAAAKLFETSPVFILTGAPGTGKTYTVARLVQALKGQNGLLCAPTGKAAKQMTNALRETCGGMAITIHSALGPEIDEETGEFSFAYGPGNELPYSYVVIDEFSMVDVRLGRQLLGALRSGTRILFVGDRHQLPSVGPGSLLRDMIAAGVPSFELTEIKRNEGRIVTACHAIKDGKTPTPSEKLDLATGENWRHIEEDDPAAIMRIIESLYRVKIPLLGIVGDLRWDVQCIAPMNEKGSLSCKAINELVQGILNPNREAVEWLAFSVGDKVVRLKNAQVAGAMIEPEAEQGGDSEADRTVSSRRSDPNTVRVVNGDLGTVTGIAKSDIIADLQAPARRVKLRRIGHELRLAYCMTCHKMQGSEAPIVILPLHKQFASSPIWTREWIYTAFSRAKVALITVGQLGTLRSAIDSVGNARRKTALQELLKSR